MSNFQRSNVFQISFRNFSSIFFKIFLNFSTEIFFLFLIQVGKIRYQFINQKMNQRIACFIGIIISLFGLFSLSPSMDMNSLTTDNRPATASQVDLTKFAKTWYEQAHTPFYYEKGCTDSTSKYTLKNDGTLFLEDKCLKNGEIVGMEARAVPEDSTNSKLKIQPYKYLDIGSQYWIFKIDQEYTYFVGGKPDLRDFWIYSSEPKIDEDLYDSIIKELKKDDFPVERLIRSDHS